MLCFPAVPWSSWEEKASLASQDQVCSSPCTLEEWPCWGWGAGRAHLTAPQPLPLRDGEISLSLSPASNQCPWTAALCPVSHHLIEEYCEMLSCLGHPGEGHSTQKTPLFYRGRFVLSCSLPCHPAFCHLILVPSSSLWRVSSEDDLSVARRVLEETQASPQQLFPAMRISH